MYAPCTQRFLILPLAAAAFIAVGCPVTPPPPGQPVLFASAGKSTLARGDQTTITVRSVKGDLTPGSGSVTATIAQVDGADIATIAAAGGALTEPTAVLTVDAAGLGTFDFLCLGIGAAVVSLTADTGDATATINCVEPEVPRTVAIDKASCETFLIADGASTCEVVVTLKDQADVGVPNVNLSVRVDNVTLVPETDGTANTSVLKAQADPAAPAASTLAAVVTDPAGRATFFVRSPVFDLQETISFTVTDDSANSDSADVVILPFENKSSVTLTAVAQSISSATSTDVTVTGFGVNTAPAAGKRATITLANGLTATADPAGGCLADNAGVLEATLDVAGRCSFAVTAPTTGVELAATVSASFLAIEGRNQEPRTANLALRVTPVGVTVANVVSDRTLIFADADPSTSTTTVSITGDDGGVFNAATVTATVASESRGVIKLVNQRIGNAGAPQAVANQDVAVVRTPTDGVVSFTIAADNRISRGNGRLVITVVGNDGAVIEGNAVVNVTVDRQPLLSSLVFDAFSPNSKIGVPGGPLPSSTGLSFKLLDEENNPVANVPVRFEAQSSVPGVVVVPFDTSNAAGIVSTVVTAGRVAGPITIVAIVESPALTAVAPPVVVVGGLPNSSYSSLLCANKAVRDPFTTECTVSLADKFTNVVETDLNVQFRAEGGNITPSATANGGSASATFTFSQPGPGSADVRGWSYSPLTNAAAAVRNRFPGCFDLTTRTSCDLLSLCSPADNDPNREIFEAFCPLPKAIGGASLCSVDISPTTRQALVDERNNADAWELALFFPDLSTLPATIDPTEQFEAYSREYRVCGMPVSCLTGDLDGLGLDNSDDCPVNPGCLDFNAATECPQNGLLDVLAAVRGEEGFDDENGNGVRDDNESFVDFPEPFLDKNSSCSYDSLNTNPGLTAGEKVRLSDLFIDTDAGDGLFGFDEAGIRTETNGTFNADTEIFVTTSIVLLGQGGLQLGAITPATSCGSSGAAVISCTPDAQAADVAVSSCTEVAVGRDALLQGCTPDPDSFREGETATLGFRWTDRNGNCPTADFEGAPIVTAEGQVILAVDDGAYSQGECGASPGAIGAANPERPWCEEHPAMGAPIRRLSITADCQAESGPQLVKLKFELDGEVAIRTFFVGCPVCGDGIIEGDNEECDDGDRNEPASGANCSSECTLL